MVLERTHPVIGSAARRQTLRRRHERLALAYFHHISVGGVSRGELAAVLGVSESTAKRIVATLLARGAIAPLRERGWRYAATPDRARSPAGPAVNAKERAA